MVCRKRLGTCVVALGRARTREICISMHLVVENVLLYSTTRRTRGANFREFTRNHHARARLWRDCERAVHVPHCFGSRDAFINIEHTTSIHDNVIT